MDKQTAREWTPPFDNRRATTTAIGIFCPDSDAGDCGLLYPTMTLLQGLLENPKVERIFPISLAGGPAPLAHPEALREDSLSLIQRVDDALAAKRLARTIFAVMHGGGGGCAYCNTKIRGKLPGCPLENQMQERDDLPKINRTLAGSYSGVATIRTIYVWFNKGSLDWEEVP